jgi:hypothetical protein
VFQVVFSRMTVQFKKSGYVKIPVVFPAFAVDAAAKVAKQSRPKGKA